MFVLCKTGITKNIDTTELIGENRVAHGHKEHPKQYFSGKYIAELYKTREISQSMCYCNLFRRGRLARLAHKILQTK